jgi:hypothetical protein
MFVQKKVTIKLEGCLEEKTTSKICDHGNHEDSCLLCEKEQKEKAKDNRQEFFSSFNNTIDLENQ